MTSNDNRWRTASYSGGEGGNCVELPVVPRTLQELKHQNAHAVADRAQCGAHGGGRLTLAGTGVDED